MNRVVGLEIRTKIEHGRHMTASAPINLEVRRRMRQVISIAIATRSCPVEEAAAEAKWLGMGLQPSLPASMVDAVVTDLLEELVAYVPSVESVEINGQVLHTVPQDELVDTLAYAMRTHERGKARRTGVECAFTLAANVLVRSLGASDFVLLRRKSVPSHPGGGT